MLNLWETSWDSKWLGLWPILLGEYFIVEADTALAEKESHGFTSSVESKVPNSVLTSWLQFDHLEVLTMFGQCLLLDTFEVWLLLTQGFPKGSVGCITHERSIILGAGGFPEVKPLLEIQNLIAVFIALIEGSRHLSHLLLVQLVQHWASSVALSSFLLFSSYVCHQNEVH